MADPEVRFERMIARLKEGGHRITPQRMAVLNILAESMGHPGVEDIYQKIKPNFPSTSIATVYKTLALLKDIGEVFEIEFSDGFNRYDGNKPYPHPHLICVGCKEILDPEVTEMKGLSEKVASKTGYRILSHRLDLFGLCPKCQSKDGS
jgi:Fur family peroxide stress response transcriptional regulator